MVLAKAANRAAVEELLAEGSRARVAGENDAALVACERKRARHPHVEPVMRRNGVGDLLALLRSE